MKAVECSSEGGLKQSLGGPEKSSLGEKLRFLLREKEAEGTLGWAWAHEVMEKPGKGSAEPPGE